MKKSLIILFALSLLYSCQKDDEDVLVAQCNLVSDVTIENVSSNSVTIAWTHETIGNDFTVEYGISGFSQGSGTLLQLSSTTINLTGLLANTSYEFYVRANCDTDNFSSWSSVQSFTTNLAYVVPELRPHLSELNLYVGDLKDLIISPRAFQYKLSTPLFTDYAHKQRIIALPENTSMEFDGDGLPIFPDNTVIAKTFFYNADERDLTLGRTIIETRILLKINGEWETGDYKWNAAQTEATLDLAGSEVPISWIDADGTNFSTNYKIPSDSDCATCHNNYDQLLPIGPKLRTMNFEINGVNQLEQFISNNQLTGISSHSSVRRLPNWQDTSVSLEDRARAYMDINCAHCHIPGGQCEDQSTLNLAFETSLNASNIVASNASISYRISFVSEGISMPFIGTTLLHSEGVALIQSFLDTL